MQEKLEKIMTRFYGLRFAFSSCNVQYQTPTQILISPMLLTMRHLADKALQAIIDLKFEWVPHTEELHSL